MSTSILRTLPTSPPIRVDQVTPVAMIHLLQICLPRYVVPLQLTWEIIQGYHGKNQIPDIGYRFEGFMSMWTVWVPNHDECES